MTQSLTSNPFAQLLQIAGGFLDKPPRPPRGGPPSHVIRRGFVLFGLLQGGLTASLLTLDMEPSPRSLSGCLFTAVCVLGAAGFWFQALRIFLAKTSAAAAYPIWLAWGLGTAVGISGRILSITLARSGTLPDFGDAVPFGLFWLIATIATVTDRSPNWAPA